MNAVMEALPGRLADRADATLEEQCSWWYEEVWGGGEYGDDESGAHPTRVDPEKKVAEGTGA